MAIHRVGTVLILLVALCAFIPMGQAQQSDMDRLAEAARLTSQASAYAYEFQLDTQMQTQQGAALDSMLLGTGSLTLNGDQPALALNLIGHLALDEQFVPVSLDARVVDGILYTPTDDGQRWRGVALAELLPLTRDVALSRFLSAYDSRFAADALMTGVAQMPSVAAGLAQTRQALMQTDLAPFVSVEALADTVIDAAHVSHFRAEVDVRALLASESGAALLRALLALSPQADSPAPWAEVLSYSALLASALDGTTLALDYYIGSEDGYLRRVVADLDLALDLSRLQAGEAVTLSALLDLQLSDFNQVEPILAPENAIIIGGLANALGIQPAPQEALLEPAPQQTEAQPILPGEPTEIMLTAAGPVDLVYAGAAGEVVNIVVRSLEVAGTVDTTVEVLDADGVRLAFNDDHVSSRADLQPFDSQIENLELPASASYTIRVTTFSGAAEGRVEVLVEAGQAAFSPTPIPTPTQQAAVTPATNAVIAGEVPDGAAYTYSFQGAAGQVLTITASATTDELDPRLTLLSPSGVIVAENDDHADADPALRTFDARVSAVALPETGSYTVNVTGFAATGGPFELTIAVEGEVPLDTIDTDQPQLGVPELVEGSIAAAGDRYIFPLEVEAGDVYTITAASLDGVFDPQLYIYDANDFLIIANDEHGSTDSSLSFTDSRIQNYIFQQAGRYEIEILGWRDSTGRFELSVTQVAANAPLGVGESQVIVGDIAASGRFRQEFEAQQGDYVTITVRGLTVEMDTQVVLIDSSGMILADNDDNGYFSDPTLARYDARINNFIIPADGVYTLEVTGYLGSAGSFAMTITTLR